MIKLIFLILSLSVQFANISFAGNYIQVSKLNEVSVEEFELDYSLLNSLERIQTEEEANFKKDLKIILKAKFKIINGDLPMAEFYLNQINDQTTSLLAVKNRYLSTIKFIQGNFKDSLKYADSVAIRSNSNYKEICLLKLINQMTLNLNNSLREEYQHCTVATEKYSKNDQFWLETMYKLKMKDTEGMKKQLRLDIERNILNEDIAKIWLKTGLYLNKESDFIALLSIVPESSYQSKKMRELIGLMYLRNGDKEKAKLFIDDVNSANSENIKGTIALKDKQYELAFGHFKLALSKKEDSENSLERALPLSYQLEQFEDGLDFIARAHNKNVDPRKIRTVKAAFLIRLKKYAEARDEIEILKSQFQYNPPFEISIMDSYLGLVSQTNKKFDKRKIDTAIENSCKNFDGMSCWINLTNIQWENLGKTVQRDDEIIADKNFTIESLKEKKDNIPLIEDKIIDQRDIEELDSSLIRINPN